MGRVILLCAVALSFGCRDLSYREPDAENLPPKVSFVGLSGEDTVALRPRLELKAEDADGVASVSLSCGTNQNGPFVPLVSWDSAPFAADVPLSNCTAGATLNGAGNAVVTLVARATDSLGSSGGASLTLAVNPRMPNLTVDVPARARPGTQVPVTLTSTEPLSSPPSLLVDGVPVVVTAGAAPNQFLATFDAPLLGTDVSGAPQDLATLENVERALTLDITAVGEQGNRVELQRQVKVSRLLWERFTPARLWRSTGDVQSSTPRASAGGLWLAIETESGSMNGAFEWRPAFLQATNGQFVAPLVGDFTGVTFSASGDPLVEQAELGITRLVGVNSEQLAEWKEPLPFQPLFHFSDRTCVAQDPRATCVAGPVSLRCYGPGSAVQNTTSFAFSGSALPNIVATSGDVAVGLELFSPICQGTDASTILWATPTTVTGAGTIPEAIFYRRLLPVADTGRFIVAYEHRTLGPQVGRIQNGQFTALPITAQHPLLAVRADESLLQLETQPGAAVLSALTPSGAVSSQALPLRVEHVAGTSILPTNVVTFPDGRFAFVARGSDYSRLIIAVDADLKPSWIFRYDRPTATTHLVRGSSGPLYFVDAENNYVAAFHDQW